MCLYNTDCIYQTAEFILLKISLFKALQCPMEVLIQVNTNRLDLLVDFVCFETLLTVIKM